VPDEARFVNRVRDTLVREDGETLWLLAGIPRRWLAPGKKIQLSDVATYFGPMSLETTASELVVSARIQLPVRNAFKTAWLAVRAPGGKPVKCVEIAGPRGAAENFHALARMCSFDLIPASRGGSAATGRRG